MSTLRRVAASFFIAVFGVAVVGFGQKPVLALDELEDELGIHPSDLTGLPAGGVALAECGVYDPGTEPTEQDVVYRTIDLPGEADVLVKLDQYDSTATGTIHALVVVHGGAWYRSCKKHWSDVASDAARVEGFMVFNIDYRLACSSSPDPEIDQYCGWKFAHPADDVGFAIAWVRDQLRLGRWIEPGQTWSGKIGVLGGSAGGNLGFLATTFWTGDSKPNMAAGWSGFPEMGFLDDGSKACDLSNNPSSCWRATENYINCPLEGPGSCPRKWSDASPDSWIGTGDPEVFIANATNELSPWESAVQFHGNLEEVPIVTELCKVIGSAHGQSLRFKICDGTGQTVWVRTIAFLKANA